MKFAIIRSDGNKTIGMGHLFREIDIAKELQKQEYEILFITRDYPEAIDLLLDHNCDIIRLDGENVHIGKAISELEIVLNKCKRKIDLFILDILEEFYNQEMINKVKNYCDKIIVISDETERLDIEADIVFALSINQKQSNYKNRHTLFYTGLKYLPLNEKYQNVKRKIIRPTVKNILLTFGGSDPQNFSTRLIKIMNKQKFDVELTLIIGPGFSKRKELKKFSKESTIEIKENVKDIEKYFIKADMCICSAGNTLFELLTCGVPCIVLPQTKRENEHAEGIARLNMIKNLGLNFTDDQLISEINNMMFDHSTRKYFSNQAQKYLDGNGLRRIIEILKKKIL